MSLSMPDREMILAILQSDIALAGLTLVFSGFLITKADSFGSRYGDRFKVDGCRWLRASRVGVARCTRLHSGFAGECLGSLLLTGLH
jgi:hypothetical protein